MVVLVPLSHNGRRTKTARINDSGEIDIFANVKQGDEQTGFPQSTTAWKMACWESNPRPPECDSSALSLRLVTEKARSRLTTGNQMCGRVVLFADLAGGTAVAGSIMRVRGLEARTACRRSVVKPMNVSKSSASRMRRIVHFAAPCTATHQIKVCLILWCCLLSGLMQGISIVCASYKWDLVRREEGWTRRRITAHDASVSSRCYRRSSAFLDPFCCHSFNRKVMHSFSKRMLVQKLIDTPVYLKLLSAFEAERRGSVKGDIATRIKSSIASKRKTLNWLLCFPGDLAVGNRFSLDAAEHLISGFPQFKLSGLWRHYSPSTFQHTRSIEKRFDKKLERLFSASCIVMMRHLMRVPVSPLAFVHSCAMSLQVGGPLKQGFQKGPLHREAAYGRA
ncbi:hypothetical protein PR048_021862 [Dryococelus australis]|uniref:Uncharacterized protein n=1 Tax=Dryococelus australis TaxID=614101 RepID=A0ABQ9GZE6_9NEOP|nr:hypothetical protein PR048_021862 [Dryococelus australis]